ncbi:MAG: transposase [Gammaproteobacteria bacterium]|nr:transposase [Gammaproteobacteria bacterium]
MNTLLPEDVLVLDRGYFSYLILYQAIEKGIHLICRLQFGTMNEEVKAFFDSALNDTVIKYYPSAAVKTEIKQQGYHLNYRAIDLRLIKYQIGDEKYICATTLIGERYPLNEFSKVYHGRWGIEELYKISKEFINIEDFHSKTERGVKQELYAHALLINIARIFELEANNQLPPSLTSNLDQEKSVIKENYWRDFFGKTQMVKINFKNGLLVIGRHIEEIVMTIEQQKNNWMDRILTCISFIRQKIRPGRHYPRQSRKPYTRWQSSNASKKTVSVGA